MPGVAGRRTSPKQSTLHADRDPSLVYGVAPGVPRLKLAHFSDIHVTIPPFGPSGSGLLGKRLAGTANYYVGGRGRHFRDAETRIAKLLDDIERARPGHALCTGDVTQMSWEEEFRKAAELFGPRREHPEAWTVLPGNHDRYTAESAQGRWFERAFGRIAPERYPYVKPLDGGRVHLVAIDVTRPAGLIDSSGECGPRQLGALESILTDPSLDDGFVILAMHYGLRRANGSPDRARHGIRDYRTVEDLFAREDVRLDLILHGHMHRPYVVEVSGRKAICVGSGTDLATGGGWHLLEIDPESRRVELSRRVWSSDEQAYVDAPGLIPGQESLS